MSSVVAQVNSTPLYGGISDGYKRNQLSFPTGTAGQPPKFRGAENNPGRDVKAPPILSSAARNNQGTNVTIPYKAVYPRIVPADELSNKGRLSTGDVAFVSRYQVGVGQVTERPPKENPVRRLSIGHAHATVSQLVGIDYVNRRLGPENYVGGKTVLVESNNPADDWRKLSLLNEYSLDGIVMGNDSPGYVMSSSHGVRNDQIFNIAVQGPAQLNNGYQDDAGRGVASNYERASVVGNGIRDEARLQSLISGPFYNQYPLQMFDRKVRPMSEFYVGLICRKIEGDELKEVNAESSAAFDQKSHIHVFKYVCFSSRQVWQFATKDVEGNRVPDPDIVDTNGNMNLGTAEPASRRRGPNDPKRDRNETDYLSHKRARVNEPNLGDSFLGIRRKEVENMVGAWRIGRVLDVASQRKQGFMSGPIDTACAVTLNVDVSFMDWRALRRSFSMNLFAKNLYPGGDEWSFDRTIQKFDYDIGRVMQWPTMYQIYDEGRAPSADVDTNIPVNPVVVAKSEDGHPLQPRGSEIFFAARKPENEQRTEYQEAAARNGALRPVVVVDNLIGASSSAVSLTEVVSSPSVSLELSATTAVLPQTTSTPVPPQDPPPVPMDANQSSTGADRPTLVAEKADAPLPPQAARSEAAKRSSGPPPMSALSGAIGDDVMASIFGGRGADASTTSARGGTAPPPQPSPAQPKSFPRRSRDR